MTSVTRWPSPEPVMISLRGGPAPVALAAAWATGIARDGSDQTDISRADRPAVPGSLGAPGDDRSVVKAVLGGDRDAFRALVDREGPSLVATCTRILGDRAEAEDVAQEAFVTAFRSLGTWRGEGSLGAWLSRIGVRLALRRAARRRSVVWLDPLAAESDKPGRERERAGGWLGAPDPAIQVLRSEQDAEVRAAVAALDEPYREVVALRFFAERSLSEIAELTDRPLGTVKTHLHRGLARLRRTIGESAR